MKKMKTVKDYFEIPELTSEYKLKDGVITCGIMVSMIIKQNFTKSELRKLDHIQFNEKLYQIFSKKYDVF